MRTQVQSLASLSGLRIRRCCELWCRSQTQLGSRVAVAWAVSTALIRPLAWEGEALKRQKKVELPLWFTGIAVSCGGGRQCSTNIVLLELWHTLIGPQNWELPYAGGVVKKKKKKLAQSHEPRNLLQIGLREGVG